VIKSQLNKRVFRCHRQTAVLQ